MQQKRLGVLDWERFGRPMPEALLLCAANSTKTTTIDATVT